MDPQALKTLDRVLDELESGEELPSVDELSRQGLIQVVTEPGYSREVLLGFQEKYLMHSWLIETGNFVRDQIATDDLDRWVEALRIFRKAGGEVFDLPFRPNMVSFAQRGQARGKRTSPDLSIQQPHSLSQRYPWHPRLTLYLVVLCASVVCI